MCCLTLLKALFGKAWMEEWTVYAQVFDDDDVGEEEDEAGEEEDEAGEDQEFQMEEWSPLCCSFCCLSVSVVFTILRGAVPVGRDGSGRLFLRQGVTESLPQGQSWIPFGSSDQSLPSPIQQQPQGDGASTTPSSSSSLSTTTSSSVGAATTTPSDRFDFVSCSFGPLGLCLWKDDAEWKEERTCSSFAFLSFFLYVSYLPPAPWFLSFLLPFILFCPSPAVLFDLFWGCCLWWWRWRWSPVCSLFFLLMLFVSFDFFRSCSCSCAFSLAPSLAAIICSRTTTWTGSHPLPRAREESKRRNIKTIWKRTKWERKGATRNRNTQNCSGRKKKRGMMMMMMDRERRRRRKKKWHEKRKLEHQVNETERRSLCARSVSLLMGYLGGWSSLLPSLLFLLFV